MIFLDMDGVVSNFVKAACEVHDKPEWTVDCWDFMTDKWNMSHKDFWKPINDVGFSFWSNLEPYPEGMDLVEYLDSLGVPWYFLSTPSKHPTSVYGKLFWLQRYISKDCRNWIFTEHKYLMAGPDRLLIDDSVKNCEMFSEYGGISYVYKRPWNDNSPYPQFTTEDLKPVIDMYAGRTGVFA